VASSGSAPGPGAGDGGIASARAETVPAKRSECAEVGVSTRTYIVLAALTGLLILLAFAFQVVLVNR
jgi:hypothetical protein